MNPKNILITYCNDYAFEMISQLFDPSILQFDIVRVNLDSLDKFQNMMDLSNKVKKIDL